MTKTIKINIANRIKFYYDTRNHIWIYLRLPFFDSNGNEIQFTDKDDNSKNFIFDTGAQNTIISNNRAKECGYLNFPIVKQVVAGGIGGGTVSCRKIKIPNITISKKIVVSNPAILIPEDKNVNINILGQDLLKPFSYYFDAQQKFIYFDMNNLSLAQEDLE